MPLRSGMEGHHTDTAANVNSDGASQLPPPRNCRHCPFTAQLPPLHDCRDCVTAATAHLPPLAQLPSPYWRIALAAQLPLLRNCRRRANCRAVPTAPTAQLLSKMQLPPLHICRPGATALIAQLCSLLTENCAHCSPRTSCCNRW